MSWKMKFMKNTGRRFSIAALMAIALACVSIMISSCGQGAAPSDTGVYGTESYDIPWGMALSKDESQIYVANKLKNNISVYDSSTMTLKYKIPTLCSPLYLTFNSDYSILYVAHDNQVNCDKSQTSFSIITTGAYISVIDVAAKKVTKEIPVTSFSSAIRDIVYDKNHNVLYALSPANPSGGQLAVINLGSNSLSKTLEYDVTVFKPMRIRYDDVKNLLYIVDIEKGNIDISSPVDPLNLEFRKIGYNKYKDGYCIGVGGRDGCPCKTDAPTACNSGSCVSGNAFPYCGSVVCDPVSYKGAEGAEKSCTTTVDSSTNCKTTSTGLSCMGTVNTGDCLLTERLALSTGDCATDAACITEFGADFKCDATSKLCEKSVYSDDVCLSALGCVGWAKNDAAPVDCTEAGDSACLTSAWAGSTNARCGSEGVCEWFVKLSSSEECRNYGYLSCNTTTGKCEADYYVNALCDTANGFTCDTTDAICKKVVYDNSLCDAALEQTCNTSSGMCATKYYKDSLCDKDGYKCDRGDGICKIDMYPNGCDCDFDTQCVGNETGTAYCSDEGDCKTYSTLNVGKISGYCDMRYDDCYDKDTVPTYSSEMSKISGCSRPTDILALSDGTAYVACYGAASGTGHENKDPLYRILLNDDGIAHGASVLITFKSATICDKPFKLAMDKSENTAMVLCTGDNRVYALDIDTGKTIKYFDVPKNSTDIVVSTDSFFVSGATSDKITKYAIPTL